MNRPILFALALALSAPSFAAPAADTVFFPDKLHEIDAAIEKAIAAHELPGGVFREERNGVAYHKAYGHRALVPREEPMTEDTIFDAASLTKVVATTPSIWILIERGKVHLDDPLSRYIPEFHGGWRDEVTIRHLLTHTSGLRPDLDMDKPWTGYAKGIELATEEMPRNRPGYVFKYSDINFELLGEVVRRVGGMPLDQFAAKNVFKPLKMNDTRFRPCVPELVPFELKAGTQPLSGAVQPVTNTAAAGQTIPIVTCKSVEDSRPRLSGQAGRLSSTIDRIAPTEALPDGTMLRGVVHDPTARRMGGVAGHAGLFTTAADVARYARMFLGGGELEGVRILRRDTVALMTSVVSPPGVAVRRAGGFDIDSGFSRPRGDLFPIGSYGHTGFTGGILWIDPFSRTFYVFLSNRVHPNGKGTVTRLQRTVGTLAAEAVRGFDFTNVPGALPKRAGGGVRFIMGGADAMNGIDVLAAQKYEPLRGLRVGLITNHTGIDRSGNPTIDMLRSAPGVELVELFSPEHGIRGVADEKVGDTRDAVTGLPIYSLYSERRQPSPDELANIDALVYDIQDIGTRFYTYESTLGLAMESVSGTKKKFFVLDRVDPIGGTIVEGPVLEGATDFVGYHTVPIRHGMTVGELAKMYRDEKHLDVDLTVIAIKGWKRDWWQDEAGLPWINTSPAMRSLDEAGLYPGIGLLESSLSVGRGTPTPFEVAGAPYIDGERLARELTALALPGIAFAPVRFTPDSSIHKGEACSGVKMTITDRRALRSVDVGIAIATILVKDYGVQFQLDKMQRLLRHPATLEAIRAGKPLGDIHALWTSDFEQRRAKYLLY